MLSQLMIKNFGLIDTLSVDFSKNLNILTGETGAGKSILIGALRCVLGERIHSTQLRDEKKPCVLQAVFEVNEDLRKIEAFEDFFQEDDTTLILQRTYAADGKNKIKINGMMATVSQLKDIGRMLIDFHGPHDHQMLLSPDSHLQMLDRLIDFGDELDVYKTHYQQFVKLNANLNKLQELAKTRDREQDLLAHQVKELEQLELDEQVFENLVAEQSRMANAEKLYASINEVLQVFDSPEMSIDECLRQAFSPMHKLNQIDEKTLAMTELLEQMQTLSEQFVSDVREYGESLSFEPQHAQEINDRFQLYRDIKRKYGPTLADAKEFYETVKAKYDILLDFENNDADLRAQIKESQAQLTKVATKIHQKRQAAAKLLKSTIEKELKELGILHVEFEARVTKADFSARGFDEVLFFISPNAGEPLKPLSQIVSSGEAARVMLALKRALIDVDPIGVLIFDEIDAQIGGRLGTVTGQKLKEISRIRQVILITHLPQIASFADRHFKVRKFVQDNRAQTTVELLDKQSRVDEIAQMMSGKDESTIALKHAKDLLLNAQK